MDELNKIKISPWMNNLFKELRMPNAVMDKYFELDKNKPMEDYFETKIKTPFDEVV